MDLARSAAVADLVHQGPHGRRADDAVLDQQHALAGQDFGQRRVLEPGLGGTVGRALDERPADVAVAHQPLDRGNAEREGHRVGGGLGGVGHRDDDRVGVERHVFQPGELLAERRPAQVDRAVVERAGDVGEVDPFEEAMRLARRRSKPLDPDSVAVGDDQRPGLERADVAEAEVGQRHALAGGAEERTMLGDAERPKAERVAHDHELAVGRDQDDVVGAVEPLGDPPEDPDPVRLLVLGLELVGQRVHDDFGVGVALQVVVALGEQLVLRARRSWRAGR